MITDSTYSAHSSMASGNAIAAGLTEANLLEDIRYFEGRMKSTSRDVDSRARAMHRVYASLLAHRRQVLAALRDGRPDAWYEYEHVVL